MKLYKKYWDFGFKSCLYDLLTPSSYLLSLQTVVESIDLSPKDIILDVGCGTGQVLRYLFTSLIARWVGVELLGIYSISNAVTRIFEVIGKLGLDQGVLRSVSRLSDNVHKQNSILSALKMGLLSSIIFMFIQIIDLNMLCIA